MLGATLASDRYLERLQNELAKINENALQRWADLIYEAWEQEKFVFIFGNGGSGTTASHMAEDLGKSTLPESELQDSSKKRLKVLSLTDNAGWIMAVGNDLSYDQLALVETLAIGYHAVVRADPQAGETVLVIGAGPIGLATLEFLRLREGVNIIVMDMVESRLQFCRDKLGIPHTIVFRPDGSHLAELEQITGC